MRQGREATDLAYQRAQHAFADLESAIHDLLGTSSERLKNACLAAGLDITLLGKSPNNRIGSDRPSGGR
jgi:hypothetical protein